MEKFTNDEEVEEVDLQLESVESSVTEPMYVSNEDREDRRSYKN